MRSLPFYYATGTSVPCNDFCLGKNMHSRMTEVRTALLVLVFRYLARIRKNWLYIFFDCLTIFWEKFWLLTSVIFFLESKPRRGNDCLASPLQHGDKIHLWWCTFTSLNMTHAYNRGYTIKIATNVMQPGKSNACELRVNSWGMANSLKVTQPFRPATLYCILSLINAPARTSGPNLGRD